MNSTQRLLILGLLLSALTLGVYWSAGQADFTGYDDDAFVTENYYVVSGLTASSLRWAFDPVQAVGWFPVTWLSHMADVELYGLNPRGHHWTNILLHLTATLLLFAFLYRTTVSTWKSLCVAALFSVHPLHVESVAWIAERRDVLAAGFLHLTLICYAEYVIRQSRPWYGMALLCAALGLMSKAVLVVLPLLLLLMDLWPLGRRTKRPSAGFFTETTVTIRQLIVEKIPFAMLAAGTVAMTLSVPSLGSPFVDKGLESLTANALIACVRYLSKIIWPSDLVIYYPFPAVLPLWQAALALLALLLTTLLAARAVSSHPYLLVGWFWFLVCLMPVLGVIRFAEHAMADRYTYLSATGIFMAAAWGVPALAAKLAWRRTLLVSLFVLAVTLSSIVSSKQLDHWQDGITLFRHAASVYPESARIRNQLGSLLLKSGHIVEALTELRIAVSLDDHDIVSRSGLAVALSASGDLAGAESELQKVIAINPGYVSAYNSLGVIYARQGNFAEAVEMFSRAVSLHPGFTGAVNNLGHAYESLGRLEEALSQYRKAIEQDAQYSMAHYNLARVLSLLERPDEALVHYNMFLAINRVRDERAKSSDRDVELPRPKGKE